MPLDPLRRASVRQMGQWLAMVGGALRPAVAPAALPAPQRVISLMPALTETVCALGAGGRLVGVDRWSNWPTWVQALPQLGGQHDVSLEALLRLQPDLIFTPRATRLVNRLQTLGLNVQALEPNTLPEIQAAFKAVAQSLDLPPAGDALWQTMHAQITAAAARLPAKLHGRSVYVEVASTPYAASAGSFMGALVSALGLHNVIPASWGPFPALNPEYVVRANPQIIIIPRSTATSLPQRPGWARIAALRTGWVCALPPEEWDTLVRPGPRLGAAAHHLVDHLMRPRS